MNQNELYHYGVLGMRWGVRRYQNRDGTLTKAGKKRAAKLETQYKTLTGKSLHKTSSSSSMPKRKSVSEMSDDELRKAVNRLQMEKQYKQLISETAVRSRGNSFINKSSNIFSKSLENAIAQATTQIIKSSIDSGVKNIKNKKK